MFTSQLCSHNFKSDNISGKIRHCVVFTSGDFPSDCLMRFYLRGRKMPETTLCSSRSRFFRLRVLFRGRGEAEESRSPMSFSSIRFSTGSFLARVCSSKKNESFQNKRPKMRLKHSLILSLLLLVHRSLGKFIFYSFSMEKFLI